MSCKRCHLPAMIYAIVISQSGSRRFLKRGPATADQTVNEYGYAKDRWFLDSSGSPHKTQG